MHQQACLPRRCSQGAVKLPLLKNNVLVTTVFVCMFTVQFSTYLYIIILIQLKPLTYFFVSKASRHEAWSSRVALSICLLDLVTDIISQMKHTNTQECLKTSGMTFLHLITSTWTQNCDIIYSLQRNQILVEIDKYIRFC